MKMRSWRLKIVYYFLFRILLASIWDTLFQSEAFRACAFVCYTSSSLLHTRLSFEEACLYLYTLASLACMLIKQHQYVLSSTQKERSCWTEDLKCTSRLKGKNAWYVVEPKKPLA